MDMTSGKFTETEEQVEILKNFIKSNPDSQEMKRALAAKLVLEGYRYQAIQQILSVSFGFISKWVNAFKLFGLKGLKSRYQGTKGFLSKTERAAIIEWLILQKSWDISELEVYLIERYDVVFQSRQSYYQLLKEARITWQKGEQVNPRYDEELTKKKPRNCGIAGKK
jgi:transposase